MGGLRPSTYFAVAALLVVLGFQLWVSPSNPPGFHHDEAAFALNAYTLAHHLRDQDGALLPIVIPSFRDYKTATFSYVAAPVVAVFGPTRMALRSVAAVFGSAAVALLALLAYRRAGPLAGVATAVAAGLTPWLFQLGRVAYDTSMFPAALALLLLAADVFSRRAEVSLRRSAFVGAALAFLTYAYPAGRLLGPLLLVASLVFAGRVAGRGLAGVWVTYAVLLLPFGAYRLRHPHGLTARYHETTFVTPGMHPWTIAWRALGNWAHDMSPWHWVVSGDRKPYVDVWGAPQIPVVVAVLAAIGLVAILRTRPLDRFWLYVVIAYLVSGIPASLTADRHDALRLSAMPVCLLALSIRAYPELGRLPRRPAVAVLAVAAAALVAEWGFFVHTYTSKGVASRVTAFEAGVPALLAQGFANGATIYTDYDDAYARTYAEWYAADHHLGSGRVVRLPDGGDPPNGAQVFGRMQSCDFTCVQEGSADSFWLARAEIPASSG